MGRISIGESLRRARMARRLTGDQVAEKMGMSAPAYRRYERNEVQPTIDRMSQLADIYRISLDELCWGSDEKEAVRGGPSKAYFDVQQGERFSIVISINGHVPEKPIPSNKKKRLHK